ncbi:MAG: glycosyl hydrolase family 28-related protein [Myxococcota bacterium]
MNRMRLFLALGVSLGLSACNDLGASTSPSSPEATVPPAAPPPIDGDADRVARPLRPILAPNPFWTDVTAPPDGYQPMRGDGVHDDTKAFQALLLNMRPWASPEMDDFRVLYLPPGDYRITAPLYLTHVSDVRIIGSGADETRVFYDGEPTDTLFWFNGQRSNFEGVTFDANRKANKAFEVASHMWDRDNWGEALRLAHGDDELEYRLLQSDTRPDLSEVDVGDRWTRFQDGGQTTYVATDINTAIKTLNRSRTLWWSSLSPPDTVARSSTYWISANPTGVREVRLGNAKVWESGSDLYSDAVAVALVELYSLWPDAPTGADGRTRSIEFAATPPTGRYGSIWVDTGGGPTRADWRVKVWNGGAWVAHDFGRAWPTSTWGATAFISKVAPRSVAVGWTNAALPDPSQYGLWDIYTTRQSGEPVLYYHDGEQWVLSENERMYPQMVHVSCHSNWFRDLAFVNGDFGLFVGGLAGILDSEGLVERSQFLNNREAGFRTQHPNAVNWNIVESHFENNGYGAYQHAGHIFVRDSTFRGQTIADLHGRFFGSVLAQNCVSEGSNRFMSFAMEGGSHRPVVGILGCTIIDPQERTAVSGLYGGHLLVHDSTFITRANEPSDRSPVIDVAGPSRVFVGNTFSVEDPLGGHEFSADNRVLSPQDLERPRSLFKGYATSWHVPPEDTFTVYDGEVGSEVGSFVDAAAARYAETGRPVVLHIPWRESETRTGLSLNETLTVPARTPLYIVGDGDSFLTASRQGRSSDPTYFDHRPLVLFEAPSHAVVESLQAHVSHVGERRPRAAFLVMTDPQKEGIVETSAGEFRGDDIGVYLEHTGETEFQSYLVEAGTNNFDDPALQADLAAGLVMVGAKARLFGFNDVRLDAMDADITMTGGWYEHSEFPLGNLLRGETRLLWAFGKQARPKDSAIALPFREHYSDPFVEPYIDFCDASGVATVIGAIRDDSGRPGIGFCGRNEGLQVLYMGNQQGGSNPAESEAESTGAVHVNLFNQEGGQGGANPSPEQVERFLAPLREMVTKSVATLDDISATRIRLRHVRTTFANGVGLWVRGGIVEPSPGPDASAVPRDAELRWRSTLSEIEAFHVYLGASRDEVAAARFEDPAHVGTAVEPVFRAALESGQRYFWRVDEVVPGGFVHKGPTRTFQTAD